MSRDDVIAALSFFKSWLKMCCSVENPGAPTVADVKEDTALTEVAAVLVRAGMTKHCIQGFLSNALSHACCCGPVCILSNVSAYACTNDCAAVASVPAVITRCKDVVLHLCVPEHVKR